MLSVNYLDDEIQLIMRPDQSLSWRGNQYLLLFVTIWMSCFATLLIMAGAWMVLPFVGLELLALGVALYYVSWKLSHRQVVEIDQEQITITQGRQQPVQRHIFSRNELVIHVQQPEHPWGRPTIELRSRGRPAIRLGEFLNRDDCQQLLQLLKSAHLRTRQSLGQVRVAL